MKVHELMTKKPHTCDPRDSVNDAAQIMWEHDCGCVPIVDGANVLIGMMTDRDVAMAAYTQGRRLSDISVLDAMARRVFSCEEDTSLASAQALMRQHGLRRLPITDASGKLTGLLTLSDLSRASERASDAPGPSEIADTLTAVSGHHDERAFACCAPRSSDG